MFVRRMLALALGLVALAVPPGAGAQPASPSVRLGTYNAFLMSPAGKCFNPAILDCLAQVAGQTEGWANRLADTILANPDQLDIIVINEAWDEDAKDILVRRLRAPYPTYVKKIDSSLVRVRVEARPGEVSGSTRINFEDSGLMLFARRGFTVLPLPDARRRWGDDDGETLEASTPHVAFAYYEACGGDDCLSAKGAALIRLRKARHTYDIVFTHTQADYPPGELYPQRRGAQLRQIEDLIRDTLPGLTDRLAGGQETVIVAGDLNVPSLKQKVEWRKLFDTPQSFFTLPMYDAWARTTSPDDAGETNILDHERLDYVLASPFPFREPMRQAPVCVQHMTVPVAFRDLESDHNMVHADLNAGFHHCSPAIAYPVKLSEDTGAVTVDATPGKGDVTRIEHPGAMQWFFVEARNAGTYSIGVDNPNLRVDVYLPEDLTTPVSRYNETPAAPPPGARPQPALNQYVLPGAFYVRVRGKDRATTGNYYFAARRHACSSQADACYLQPGLPTFATLSAFTIGQQQLQPQNEAWFRFDAVGQADSGQRQTITLTAELEEAPRVRASIVGFSNPSGGALTQAIDGARTSFSGPVGDGAAGYMVVRQSSPGQDRTTIKATLATNLRLMAVHDLVCEDETNPEAGSDDIFTVFTVDGTSRRAPAGDDEVEFDCDDTPHPQAWAPKLGQKVLRYLDTVKVRVVEGDDASANDGGQVREVITLSGDRTFVEGRVLDWRFDDGIYKLYYDLRMRPNAPVADPP